MSEHPKPSVGRIVLFRSTQSDHVGNGASEVPAIITRVWTDTCVNLQVMRDAASPIPMTSVVYDEDPIVTAYATWRWPPRD